MERRNISFGVRIPSVSFNVPVGKQGQQSESNTPRQIKKLLEVPSKSGQQ
jgi:hypothetical protein